MIASLSSYYRNCTEEGESKFQIVRARKISRSFASDAVQDTL